MADLSTPAVAERTAKKTPRRLSTGIQVSPVFCPTDVADPFDTVEWELPHRRHQGRGGRGAVRADRLRSARVLDASWPRTSSSASTSTARSTRPSARTASGSSSTASPARSPIGASQDGYFATPEDGERFYRDLTWLCLHQHGAFNSPVWFNVGLYHQYGVKGAASATGTGTARPTAVEQPENPYEYPQGSACFIQSVHDNMEDIMELARSEAMLFKFGSGTGTDLSTLRSHREKLSGGGKPSRPAVVHAGLRPDRGRGEERRQDPPRRQDAVAQGLAPGHHGVHRVQGQGREEGPHADRSSGYDSNFNGEAYSSILFQNANLSVRVTDEFMQAVRRGQALDHALGDRRQARPAPSTRPAK